MNIFSCIATYDGVRIIDLLRNISQCYCKGTTLILFTGEKKVEFNPIDQDFLMLNSIIHSIEPKPRFYGEIMKEKVDFCEGHCNDDSIVFMMDDDYFLNQYTYKVMKRVFAENEEVNYLSLLRGPGLAPTEEEIINLSGFNFMKTFSCLGGSLIVRWKVFKEHFKEFLEIHGTENMFDQIFFYYLKEKLGTDKLVYTLLDFSLYQHCNLSSFYLDMKGPEGKRAHMYGESYDPRMNPFDILGISEI